MRYRKKPVVVEAVQWTGNNATELEKFAGAHIRFVDEKVAIDTREGTIVALLQDWVIKGVAGEFYPCEDEIFRQTYEAADG